MRWLIEAFWELSTDRPVGMGGMGPIPRASVTDFLREEGITDGRTFRTLIRTMDAIFLEHHHRKK